MKVNCTVKINSKETMNELPEAWSHQDYINILDLMGFAEEGMSETEVMEMTLMSLADQEPEESAALLLQYRLAEDLTEGQIKQLSHEMQEDKVSEEYPDLFLHEELFNVNQLLYKSFNGKFPNAHAIALDMILTTKSDDCMEKEEQFPVVIIQALASALGEHSAIVRLYGEELKGEKIFTDANGILWRTKVKKEADHVYKIQLFSSEYWLHDLPNDAEYNATFEFFEEIAIEE